jgi:hypothetical protein
MIKDVHDAHVRGYQKSQCKTGNQTEQQAVMVEGEQRKSAGASQLSWKVFMILLIESRVPSERDICIMISVRAWR